MKENIYARFCRQNNKVLERDIIREKFRKHMPWRNRFDNVLVFSDPKSYLSGTQPNEANTADANDMTRVSDKRSREEPIQYDKVHYHNETVVDPYSGHFRLYANDVFSL